MSNTAAARTATDMRSAAAYVATATNMRTASMPTAATAALLRGRGIGPGRQRGRKNNCGDSNREFRHVILHRPRAACEP